MARFFDYPNKNNIQSADEYLLSRDGTEEFNVTHATLMSHVTIEQQPLWQADATSIADAFMQAHETAYNHDLFLTSDTLPGIAITEVYVVSNISERNALSDSSAVQSGDVCVVNDTTAATYESYIWDGATWIVLGSQASLLLNQIIDVNAPTPSQYDVLAHDGTTWVNSSSLTLSSLETASLAATTADITTADVQDLTVTGRIYGDTTDQYIYNLEPADYWAFSGGIRILERDIGAPLIITYSSGDMVFSNNSTSIAAGFKFSSGNSTGAPYFGDKMYIDGNGVRVVPGLYSDTLSALNTNADLTLAADGTGKIVASSDINLSGGHLYKSGINVTLPTDATDGQIAVYDAGNSEWIAGTVTSGTADIPVQDTPPAGAGAGDLWIDTSG